MREIKFRAWDTKTRQFMFPWPDGFVLFGETTCFDLIGQQFERGEDRLLRYNDLDVQQYTGLKDKNGKEIYEGDILKHEFYHRPLVVEYEGWGFGCIQDDGQKMMPNQEYREVIGNIYENPEVIW